MTQDEKWLVKYNEVMEFMEREHRNPSKHRIEHRIEEHNMLNWIKANRKVMNAGKLKEERTKKLNKLLELIEDYKRVNQYV